MEWFIIILSIPILIIIILLIFLIASVIYMHTEGKFFSSIFHDKLEWHIPNGKFEISGITVKSHCKICGKEIMQDSQGNWF